MKFHKPKILSRLLHFGNMPQSFHYKSIKPKDVKQIKSSKKCQNSCFIDRTPAFVFFNAHYEVSILKGLK